jgi:hypothetical protein
MVKKAALSVRISASTKKALEKAADEEHRSTAALVEIILRDWLHSRLIGAPRNEASGASPFYRLLPKDIWRNDRG